MWKKYLSIFAFVFLISSTQMEAQAASAGTFHAGAQFGLVAPSDNLQTRFGFGARFGYQIYDEWSIGLSYLYSSSDFGTNGIVSLSFMEILLDSYYHYEAWRFGAKFGIFRLGAAVLGLTGSSSDFAAGPAIGYDFEIPGAPGLTIGPEASVIFDFLDGTTLTVFDFLAVVKYHF